MPRSPHSDGLHSQGRCEQQELGSFLPVSVSTSMFPNRVSCMKCLSIIKVLFTYLQTLGGALMGPSAQGAGCSAGGRHKP